MEYLQKEDIILINQMTIKRHGGNYVPPSNILNEGPLDYLLEAVDSEMFGKELYPKIPQKAGLYMFSIISNHVFQDGNKRTGLGSALLFLRLNGYKLKDTLERPSRAIPASNTQILIEFTLDVASGKISPEECQEWFKEHITKTK